MRCMQTSAQQGSLSEKTPRGRGDIGRTILS